MHVAYEDPHSVRDDGDLPDDLDGDVGADGQRVGVWRSRHPDGSDHMVVPYEGGRVHGELRVLADDGSLRASEAWVNGVRHGPFTAHREDGARQSGAFVNGRMEGPLRVFDPAGRMVLEEQYVNGLPHGPSTLYDEAGRVREETRHHEGLPDGVWILRDETGNAVGRSEFARGAMHGAWKMPGLPSTWRYVHGVRVGGGFSWCEPDGSPAAFPFVRMGLGFAAFVALFAVYTGMTSTLLALGAAIAVHEGGHFLHARWVGIPIGVYRIGFGPRIASFVVRTTVVDIRLIPLFGYVMPATVRPSALPRVRHALGRGAEPTAEIDLDEAPVAVSELVPPGPRIVFELGGVVANVVAAIAVRALVSGTSPVAAAAWVMERMVQMISVMPRIVLDLFSPTTYLADSPGLLAAGHEHVTGLDQALMMFVIVNVVLAAFNLLPLPPLDGFRVVCSTLEAAVGKERADAFARPLRMVGMLFFVVLILGGVWFMGRDLWSIVAGN